MILRQKKEKTLKIPNLYLGMQGCTPLVRVLVLSFVRALVRTIKYQLEPEIRPPRKWTSIGAVLALYYTITLNETNADFEIGQIDYDFDYKVTDEHTMSK